GVKVSTTTITPQISMNMDEITLAKALIDIKTSKPKAKGIVMQEPSETPTPTPIDSSQRPSKAKDKAQMQAELEEEEKRLTRQKEKEANIALTESWHNIQAMMDIDYELAAKLQEEERGELTIEEKSRLFVELMDKRKKYFARLRAEKSRSKPPTKTQKRNKMCTYLKNMANYKHSQLKNKSFEEIKMLFNNTIKQMFKNFNREDLESLWSIIKARFKKTKPVDDMDNLLFQTLKIMFEHHVEDNIRKCQQGLAKVLNWKLFNSCGVYCVTTQNMVYYLLVEKMYPLTRNILHQIWNDVRLQVDYEVEMAYDLLRLIRRQISEGYGRIVGIKRLHDDIRITATQEDANLKLLRSLLSAWKNIAWIMRNKSNIDALSMDDLYNNLKVYESEIKSQSSSSSNSQNVAFVSSDNSSSTNETVNTAHNVSTASSKDQASTASYADDVMFSFFSNQSNAPQLDNKDLEQIDTDDLKEIDLKWQVVMLTMRVKRFIKKTRRKLDLIGKDTVRFDKTKVECYNCYRRGHFARECMALRNQGNINRDAPTKNAPVDTSTTNALVVQDRIGGYDWSFQAEEELTNFALMEYISQGSSSLSSLDSELENALKEKDDLKLKLEKFETSSKNLTKLINSQISTIDKTGLGYDVQMNERDLNDIHVNESEVLNNVFDSRKSDGDDSQVNDRFKKGEGYHAVPPPYTRNYISLRADLSFVGLDNSVFKSKVSETITSVPKIETIASKTSKDSLEKPKTIRSSAPLIEEWESDSEDENMFEPKEVKKQSNLAWKRLNLLMLGIQLLKMKTKLKNLGILTKSRQVPVNAAKQSSHRAAASVSAARRVNTAASVNNALPTTSSYFKAHSPVRRPFNQKLLAKTNNFNENVNTAKGSNVTTAGPKAVVSAAEGNRNNAVKLLACWIWRPKGNLIDHISNDRNAKEGTKANIDAGQARKKTIPGPQYVLLPLLTSNFQGPKSSEDEVAGKNSTEVPRKKNGVQDPTKEGDKNDQEKDLRDQEGALIKQFKQEYERLFDQRETANINSTNRLNTCSSLVNAVSSSFTIMDPGREIAQRNEFESMFGQDKDGNGNRMFTLVSATGSTYVNPSGSIPVNAATLHNVDLYTNPLMPNLEDTVDLQDTRIFSGAYDNEVEGVEANFNNLELTIVVIPIPKTKIHKDHPKEQIIRDPLSTPQTKRMTKTSQEHAMMDVKSAFLYGTIEEEVYVCQPPGFENPHFPDKVYKVEKSLYGLHQAPRAWYETLSTYLTKIISHSLMATLEFCDKHNMVAYLKIPTGSEGFQEIVDFLNVDGKEFTVIEASVRRHLQLADVEDKGKDIIEESESNVTKTKRQQEQERLGLETTVRLQEKFDEEERQRTARVHEATQTFIEEGWENIKARVEADEELTQRLQAEEKNKYSEVDQAKMLELFKATMRSIKDLVPMKSEDDKAVPKLAKARSSKRDAEEELDQGRPNIQSLTRRFTVKTLGSIKRSSELEITLRNYMPQRADLSFVGLDNSVFKSKVSETITSIPKIETNASKTSKDSLKKPKTVRSIPPIIKDWESDSEDENMFEPKEVKKTIKPSFEKIEIVNARNTTVENENKAKKPRKFCQSANAARNYEILHERDDDDTEIPDKRQRSGDRHQPTSQQSSHRSHGQNNDRHGSDRRGGNDNHRGSNNNNNYSSSNNKCPSKGHSYPVCTTCRRRHQGECRRAAGTCFKCGQAGHLQKDCRKNTTTSTSGQADKKPGASGRVFAITEGQAANTLEVSTIHDQPIVSEFPDVFPDELPGMPPVCEVEFNIELYSAYIV
nr:ribonuclease H-like domain-containing protein [Tanacetum cinerariifolium]